jgi:hypothetical protein
MSPFFVILLTLWTWLFLLVGLRLAKLVLSMAGRI